MRKRKQVSSFEVVVGKPTPETPVEEKSTQVKLAKPKAHYVVPAIITAGFVILFAAIYFGTRYETDHKASDACSTQSSLPLMQQTGSTLNAKYSTQLATNISKIQALPDYQKDPNCLYPIIIYYLNISDPANASKYLSEYKQVYKPNKPLIKALGATNSLSTLESNVAYLKASAANVNQNLHTITVLH